MELDDVDDLKVNLFNLKKTLTLGSGNVAPSNLTGGAALQSEDIVGKIKKDKVLKSQLFAAIRDWDKTTELSKHLSHYLKDVDERFIDKFAEMAKDLVFTKKELTLTKTEEGGKVDFKGKKVIPGKVQIISGPFSGSNLKLFFLDENSAYVEAFKAGGQSTTPINKLPRKHEGINWVVVQKPQVDNAQINIDGRKHGDPLFNRDLSQHVLLDGIDLNNPSFKKVLNTLTSDCIDKNSDHFGWFHNKIGMKVLVKPEIKSSYDNVGDFSTSQREVLFKNLASDFFKLGEYVPNVAFFKHPETKKGHSAMELVPESWHFSNDRKTIKILKEKANSGVLEKLAIMDHIMGNSDRVSHLNYLLSLNSPNIHLIDNSLIFNFNDKMIPSYIHDQMRTDPLYLDKHIKDDTANWIQTMDVFEFKHQMDSHGVPIELSAESIKRLLSVQNAVLLGNRKLKDLLFAHNRINNQVTPNEGEEDQGDF